VSTSKAESASAYIVGEHVEAIVASIVPGTNVRHPDVVHAEALCCVVDDRRLGLFADSNLQLGRSLLAQLAQPVGKRVIARGLRLVLNVVVDFVQVSSVLGVQVVLQRSEERLPLGVVCSSAPCTGPNRSIAERCRARIAVVNELEDLRIGPPEARPRACYVRRSNDQTIVYRLSSSDQGCSEGQGSQQHTDSRDRARRRSWCNDWQDVRFGPM
jgi:hypothetical protein